MNSTKGFSLIELLIVLAIISTLAAIAVPSYSKVINNARVIKAISDIKSIQNEINVFVITNGVYPATLDVLKLERTTDPWGNPYRYLRLAGDKRTVGSSRKDKNLVPLNDDYDLYSMGKDGDSQAPLTAKASHDDIVRASNGSFIGLATDY